MIYKYNLRGTGADGQTWTARGYASGDPGHFVRTAEQVMTMAFRQVVQGKAIYGFPGVGCNGPYTVTHFEVQVVPHGQANALREAGELEP